MVNNRQSNGNSSLEIGQSSQELVSKDRTNKKRTCIILGLIAIGAIIVLVSAIVITSGNSAGIRPGASKGGIRPGPTSSIALEDFLEGHMIPRAFNATWISDHELLYQDISKNIVLRNVATKTNKIILGAERVPQMTFDYELSADQRYILLAHGYQKLYSRYSFLSQYTVIDLLTWERIPIMANGKDRVLRLAMWGPSGNAIVYIFNNNIYYRPSVRIQTEIQLTTDGENGKIFNGVPDWVYEEEVLSSNKALWFSKGGRKLAYLSVNDTNVGVMNIPYYGAGSESMEFQYSKTIPLRYPKAGTPNPGVQLVTVDVESLSSYRLLPVQIAIPQPKSLGREPILGTAAWANDIILCAIWLNRIQNKAEISCCDTINSVCDTIVQLEEKNGWLEMFTAPLFNKDGSKMLIIMSHDQGGGAGGYRHVTMIDRRPNSKAVPMTRGKFVVTEILSWDENKDLIYFLANSEKDPAVQHLYSVSSLISANRDAKCISCHVKTTNTNKPCLYNGVIFSPNSSYYTLNCAGPGVPEIAVFDNSNKRIETWEINEELLDLTEDKEIPIIKRFAVDVDGGFKAQVILQLPPNLDMSGEVKYPMLINVYGGPDSYDVLEKFSLNWFSYLASNKSIIVAVIDGRGSGLKGDKMLFAGYGHLGTVEIFDQINVTRHLQKELPYIDPKRSAIWGWSYGGYAAGLALARDTENVFKCGISIAPVTDWTLYDSIYTERVMGLPNQANILNYKESSLINKIEKLRGKEYLLVHGTLDDNVHYQQSMLLAKALELKDIQFRQQTYPDEDHGLSSVRKHLYHTFEHFLDDCFNPGSTNS